MIEASVPNVADNTIIMCNRFVNKYAAEAGAMSIDTTRMTPTVCKDATVTSVKRNIKT